jgi:hypothetical protein
MRTITEVKAIYNYSELSKEAQEKAVNNIVNEWLEWTGCIPPEAMDSYNKAVNKAEAMRTPWFAGSYVYEHCKEYIENELNLMCFTLDGSFYEWIDLLIGNDY